MDTNKLIEKINFARASQFLKGRQMIQEHFPFPTNTDEEAESIKKMTYAYLKTRFAGCKLRANPLSFSVRLDGEVHRKVKKVRERVLNDMEWRKWFQDNHREIIRTIERHSNPFNNGMVEFRTKEGRDFLYFSLQTNRIYGYQNEGLNQLFRQMDEAYEREKNVADLYDQVVALIEGEINRKFEENQRRITGDRDKFMQHIERDLVKRITRVNREGTTFQDKLAARMHDWCVENGIEPMYANEPTYDRVLELRMNVDIIVRDEDTDEDWYVVPTFGGYELPEGYTKLDGYGEITNFEATGRRSRDGANPIVIMDHMYCQFNLDHWKAHLPEGFDQVLEATRRISAEVQAEVNQAEEERKEVERREREEREARARQEMQERLERQLREKREAEAKTEAERAEADRVAREEAERIARLREQLMGQLTQAQTAEAQVEPDPATFPNGVYRNGRAIPLERYVSVYDGRVRRHLNRTQAIDRLRGLGLNWTDLGQRNVRDYHDIETVVETIEV